MKLGIANQQFPLSLFSYPLSLFYLTLGGEISNIALSTRGRQMIIGIGIDLVECDRFLDWSPFKKSRIFTKIELEYADKSSSGAERHLANFWAVREAFVKAIGTGFGEGIEFSDISVDHDDNGRPQVIVAGGAKKALKGICENANIHVSITDQGDYSAAVVIVESDKVIE